MYNNTRLYHVALYTSHCKQGTTTIRWMSPRLVCLSVIKTSVHLKSYHGSSSVLRFGEVRGSERVRNGEGKAALANQVTIVSARHDA